jgi:deazaflavin-dependent oxidoreductase (nitroreductase family)
MSTSTEPKDSPTGWVNDHIRQYVASGGAEGHEWNGTTILLLTVTGRKSGAKHRTALIYREVDGDYVIVASKGGAPEHPAWFKNLQADPNVTVQVRDEVFAGRARVAEGDERARLWSLMTEVWPDYDKYQPGLQRLRAASAFVGSAEDSAPLENTYRPCSTDGGAAPSTSPCVIASRDSGTVTVTVCCAPAAKCTLVNPTSRFAGTIGSLTGCDTYTGTTRSPARPPVSPTVTRTATEPPCRAADTVPNE